MNSRFSVDEVERALGNIDTEISMISFLQDDDLPDLAFELFKLARLGRRFFSTGTCPSSNAGSNTGDTPRTPLQRALEIRYRNLVHNSCSCDFYPSLYKAEDQPLFEAFDKKHGSDESYSQSPLAQSYIRCLEDMLDVSHKLEKLQSELWSDYYQLRYYSDSMQSTICSVMSFVQRGLYTLQFPHVTPVPDWQVCGEGTLRMWLEYPTLAEQGSRGAAFAFMAPAVMERAKKLVAEGLGEEKWERLCREWEWLQE